MSYVINADSKESPKSLLEKMRKLNLIDEKNERINKNIYLSSKKLFLYDMITGANNFSPAAKKKASELLHQLISVNNPREQERAIISINEFLKRNRI